MVPIPYSRAREGRTETTSSAAAFRCPTCNGPLQQSNGSWGCTACGYVPRHGAD